MLLFWFFAMKGFCGALVAPLIGVGLKAIPEKFGSEGAGAAELIGAEDAAGAKVSPITAANATTTETDRAIR